MENGKNVPQPVTPSAPSSRVSLFEAILVIVVTFILVIFLGGVLFFLNIAIALVVGELLFLVVPLIYLLFRRVNVRSYIKANFKTEFLVLGIGFGILLLFVNIGISGVLTAIFGTSQAVEESNTLISEISKTPGGLIAVAASLSLAGICEEFAFRGFLQNTINKKYSFPVSLIISAAVFGFAHFDPQLVYMLSTFVLGLILGFIYYRWNYVVSAAAHSTMNIIVLILLLLAF